MRPALAGEHPTGQWPVSGDQPKAAIQGRAKHHRARPRRELGEGVGEIAGFDVGNIAADHRRRRRKSCACEQSLHARAEIAVALPAQWSALRPQLRLCDRLVRSRGDHRAPVGRSQPQGDAKQTIPIKLERRPIADLRRQPPLHLTEPRRPRHNHHQRRTHDP